MNFYYLIFPLILSFSFGSVLGLYIKLNPIFILLLLFCLLVTIIRIIILSYKLSLILFTSLMFVLSGILWGNFYNGLFELKGEYKDKINSNFIIEGVVISNPSEKNGKNNFIVKDNNYRILVTYSGDKKIKYGMKLKVSGILRKPENFSLQSGNVVNYESIQKAKKITLLIDAKKIEIIPSENYLNFFGVLYSFKNKVYVLISKMKPPESELLYSMVFGGKDNLNKDMLDNFRISGILHIVVLSGQNLTLIAMLSIVTFSYIFGFRAGHISAIIFVTLYAIIGGFEAATMRAYFMSVLYIILILYGKVSNQGRILLFSILIMIIINPLIFFNDPSFHLSVLAFIGIIYLSPIIRVWMINRDFNIVFSDYVSAIFGAQIMVLPYILYLTQTINIYSFLSNILILLAVGFITVYGVVVVLVSIIFNSLFDILSFPIYLMLKYVIFISRQISKLPFSSLAINVSQVFVVLVYLFLFRYIYRRWKQPDLTPLAIFEQRDNAIQIRKGNIPYVEETITNDSNNEKEIYWK